MTDYFCTHCGCRHEPLAHLDGRDPRPNPLQPIFRDHNCGGCDSGAKPCREGNYNSCSNPRARND